MKKINNKSLLIFAVFILIILILNIFVIIISSQQTPTTTAGSGTPIVPPATTPSTTTTLKNEDKKVEKEENIGNFIGVDKNEQIIANGVDLSRVDGKTTVIFRQGGYVKIKTSDGKEIVYSELGKLEGVKKEGKDITLEPQITFSQKGEIIGAAFTTGKDGDYVFGNQKINLKKGTKVYFEKGSNKVTLGVDENTQVIAPTKLDSAKADDLIFSYQAPGKGTLNIENYKIKGASLNYQSGKWFFDDKEATIDDYMLVRRDKEGIRTYLDFNGKVSKDIQGTYISMNKNEKTIVLGTNTNDDSPAVMFTKENPYGMKIEQGDHFAVKVLGNGKTSYAMISDKDRSSKDFIPEMKIVGSVAINQDNAAVGTFLKDGNFYKKIDGVWITEFKEFAGKGVVPVDIAAYKLNEKGEEIPVSTIKLGTGAQQQELPNRFVISNRGEIGVGPNPLWISGGAYSQKFPLFTRGVSNRVSYNYVPFTKEGFEKFTGIKLRYSNAAGMTPDKFRMLIDFTLGLPPENRKTLKSISLEDLGSGLMGLGYSEGRIRINYNYLSPGLLRHEATHTRTLNYGSAFWNEWEAVGGGSTAFTSNYGRTDSGEDASEFGYIYYQDTTRLLTASSQAKYYRGKLAVLTKYGIMSQNEFDYHFARAGLPYGKENLQKYITEARV